MSVKRDQRARLTHKQAHKIADWLKRNQKRIATESLTLEDTARQAGNDLGFPVMPSNIRGMAKDVLEWKRVPWSNRVPAGSYSTSESRLRFVARQLCVVIEILGVVTDDFALVTADLKSRLNTQALRNIGNGVPVGTSTGDEEDFDEDE